MRGWLAVPLLGPDGVNDGFIQVLDGLEGEVTEQDEADLVRLAWLASTVLDALAQLHLPEYRAKLTNRSGLSVQATMWSGASHSLCPVRDVARSGKPSAVDRAGHGPGDAAHGLDVGDHESAELIHSTRVDPDDDVVGPATSSAESTASGFLTA